MAGAVLQGGSRRSRLRPTHFLNLLHVRKMRSHAEHLTEHLCRQCPDVLHTIPDPKNAILGSMRVNSLGPPQMLCQGGRKKRLDSDIEGNELL